MQPSEPGVLREDLLLLSSCRKEGNGSILFRVVIVVKSPYSLNSLQEGR
jgi:hypothetical protein